MKKLFLIFCICVIFSLRAVADIVVIINSNNTAVWEPEAVRTEVKSIFLGAKEKFSNGNNAKPIDQSEGKGIRKEFYLKIANKDETAMNIYWSNLIFTGNGRPPKILPDDSSVKKFVNENISGIGYIDASSVDNTVKVLEVFK